MRSNELWPEFNLLYSANKLAITSIEIFSHPFLDFCFCFENWFALLTVHYLLPWKMEPVTCMACELTSFHFYNDLQPFTCIVFQTNISHDKNLILEKKLLKYVLVVRLTKIKTTILRLCKIGHLTRRCTECLRLNDSAVKSWCYRM